MKIIVVVVALIHQLGVQASSSSYPPCDQITNSNNCNFYGQIGGNCVWYGGEDGCQTYPYCNPNWSQTECTSVQNQGICAYQGSQCVLAPTPSATLLNVGRDCYALCTYEDVSTSQESNSLNQQCDYCGTQGICCSTDPSSPGPCTIDTEFCSSNSSLYCCAEFTSFTPTLSPTTTKPSKSPSTSEPSASPTKYCQSLGDTENGCQLAAELGCYWYGLPDGCQKVGYCNATWSQSTCEDLANIGTCIYFKGECVQRQVPLASINLGRDCRFICDVENGNNGPEGPCSFCGTAGVCCDAFNPTDTPTPCMPQGCDTEEGALCCAVPGSFAPTTGAPTLTPSTSPLTSRPSQSPHVVRNPTLSPTFAPTFFGSSVDFISTTGAYDPSVQGTQGFDTYLCTCFTYYWYGVSTCDPSLYLTVVVNPYTGGNQNRRLDAVSFEPSLTVRYYTQNSPTNTTAVALGYTASNDALRQRCASNAYELSATNPSQTQTNAPAAAETGATALGQQSIIYISVGTALFGLFILAAVICFLRYRVERYEDDYRQRGSRHIPQKPRNQPKEIATFAGADFTTMPKSGSRDYVAQEVNGIFTVEQRSGKPGSGSGRPIYIPPPQRTKSFGAPPAAASASGEGIIGAYASPDTARRDSRRSSNRNGDQDEFKSRNATLYRHQMEPYFQGRESEEPEDFEQQQPPQKQSSFGRSAAAYQQTSYALEQEQLQQQQLEQIKIQQLQYEQKFGKQSTKEGKDGMSEWI